MIAQIILLILIKFAQQLDFQPLNDLITRRANQLLPYVNFKSIEKLDDKPYFTLKSDSQSIQIEGDSLISLSVGFNHYLKYINQTISWSGDTMNDLILVESPLITKKRQFKYGYYLNTCTYSYSMILWDWERWQREIDWMVLNGINLVLMQIGQELLYLDIYKQLGIQEEAVLSFFGGPAFQAWQRMGNTQRFGGPMPKNWLISQFELSKKIVKRMREFGIKVILPAFSGFVPEELKQIYIDSNIKKGSVWNNFPEEFTAVYVLESTDPLFFKIQKMFISAQILAYEGTDHFYQLDQFNENYPSQNDPKYITTISTSTLKSLKDSDPDAVWILQSWFFYYQKAFWTKDLIEAFISPLPKNDILILDLISELYPPNDGYFGHDWIWNELHDFGGNNGWFGQMTTIIKNAPFVEQNKQGLGLTMEGIEQNQIVYDLVLYLLYEEQPNLDQFLNQFVRTRYNIQNQDDFQFMFQTWKNLVQVVYSYEKNDRRSVTKSLTELRPSLNMLHLDFMPTTNYYSLCSIYNIFDRFTQMKLQSLSYKYDITDVTRQFLVDLFLDQYKKIQQSIIDKDLKQFKHSQNIMTMILQDLNLILQTHPHFTILTRLKIIPDPQPTFEWNLINQITVWGPKYYNNNDYASKQWAGLTRYHLKRWLIFFKYLNQNFDQINSNIFDWKSDDYLNEIIEFEQIWIEKDWRDDIQLEQTSFDQGYEQANLIKNKYSIYVNCNNIILNL